MEQKNIHFYLLAGAILITTGIVSIVYSTIIPVRNYPYNVFASSIFSISGMVLIIVGILLILVMRRRFLSRKVGGDRD